MMVHHICVARYCGLRISFFVGVYSLKRMKFLFEHVIRDIRSSNIYHATNKSTVSIVLDNTKSMAIT